MDNKTGILPIADLTEIQRGTMRMKMLGFLRKKTQKKVAPDLSVSTVREADHDGANVRDAILASNAS